MIAIRTKKERPINFIIPLVVYPFDVMVSIGQSDVNLGATLDSLGVSALLSKEEILLVRYSNDSAPGRSVMFSTGQSILRMRKLLREPQEFGTLAHEIFHIATFVLDRIGCRLSMESSDEAYAYLIGYLTTQIYEKTNKYY